VSTDDLRDTAEVIDPTAADPTPEQIEVGHGDYVEPYAEATSLGGDAQ
jgi:hypothetical protein